MASEPREVRTARLVVKQSISNDDILRAARSIDQQGERVPVLQGDEQLFSKEEMDVLVGQTDESDSLVSILCELNENNRFVVKVGKLVDQVLDKWKHKHADSAAILQTAAVRAKRDQCVDSEQLDASESSMSDTTYVTGLEDLEIGVRCGSQERTILLIEMMKWHNYFQVEQSLSIDVTTSWGDILLNFVYQCVTYSMSRQRTILRNEDGQFVVVSLLVFKDAAFVIKLTSNDWWSYLYKLDVYKYTLGNTEDVNEQARDLVNLLQVCVSRILTVNSDTNSFLKDKLQQDLSQLELTSFMVESPSYAHVQKRSHEYFNHVRKCKLKDCVQSLIGQSCLIWPNHSDEFGEWLKKLEEDGENTEVVVKVVSALYYQTTYYVSKLTRFLGKLEAIVRRKRVQNERLAKYKKVLDLYVCIASRKDNYRAEVVITKYKASDRCASSAFLSDWSNPNGVAREAFHDQVCDLCIGMLEDGMEYRHGDLRPSNIAVATDEQNNHEVTVINWDNVEFCGDLVNSNDNLYPFAIGYETKPEQQLASAVCSSCQLLLCIYILHRTAKHNSSSEDCCKKAEEVECNLRYCKPLFAPLLELCDRTVSLASTEQHSEDSTACGNVNETKIDRPSTSDPVAVAGEVVATVPVELTEKQLARQYEYDCFQKWIQKMEPNVFADLNRFLTDLSGCSFELLRSHLKVALHTDVDDYR